AGALAVSARPHRAANAGSLNTGLRRSGRCATASGPFGYLDRGFCARPGVPLHDGSIRQFRFGRGRPTPWTFVAWPPQNRILNPFLAVVITKDFERTKYLKRASRGQSF